MQSIVSGLAPAPSGAEVRQCSQESSAWRSLPLFREDVAEVAPSAIRFDAVSYDPEAASREDSFDALGSQQSSDATARPLRDDNSALDFTGLSAAWTGTPESPRILSSAAIPRILDCPMPASVGPWELHPSLEA